MSKKSKTKKIELKRVGPQHAGLPPEKLRWRCDPSRIPFETTAEVSPSTGDPGQERALRALRMGVEMTAPGGQGTFASAPLTRIVGRVPTLLQLVGLETGALYIALV